MAIAAALIIVSNPLITGAYSGWWCRRQRPIRECRKEERGPESSCYRTAPLQSTEQENQIIRNYISCDWLGYHIMDSKKIWFWGVQFSWIGNLYHFVGLMFANMCAHAQYAVYYHAYFAEFIFMLSWLSVKTQRKLDTSKVFPLHRIT